MQRYAGQFRDPLQRYRRALLSFLGARRPPALSCITGAEPEDGGQPRIVRGVVFMTALDVKLLHLALLKWDFGRMQVWRIGERCSSGRIETSRAHVGGHPTAARLADRGAGYRGSRGRAVGCS